MRSGCDVSRAARASAAEPRTDSTSWARSLARHRHTAAACSLIDAASTPDQYLHSHMDTLSDRRRVHARLSTYTATWIHCLIDAASTPDQYLHSHMDTLSDRCRVHAGPVSTQPHRLIDAESMQDQYLHSHTDTLSDRRRVHAGQVPTQPHGHTV